MRTCWNPGNGDVDVTGADGRNVRMCSRVEETAAVRITELE